MYISAIHDYQFTGNYFFEVGINWTLSVGAQIVMAANERAHKLS